jgi:hypothetical protein
MARVQAPAVHLVIAPHQQPLLGSKPIPARGLTPGWRPQAFQRFLLLPLVVVVAQRADAGLVVVALWLMPITFPSPPETHTPWLSAVAAREVLGLAAALRGATAVSTQLQLGPKAEAEALLESEVLAEQF